MPEYPMFCPSCHYRGLPQLKARGNWAILLFLLFCGVLPGIFYAIACGGYDLLCPQCGIHLGTRAG
jgi:hypothetical protein